MAKKSFWGGLQVDDKGQSVYVSSPLWLVFMAAFFGLMIYTLTIPGTIPPLVLGAAMYGLLIAALFEPLVEVLIKTNPDGTARKSQG